MRKLLSYKNSSRESVRVVLEPCAAQYLVSADEEIDFYLIEGSFDYLYIVNDDVYFTIFVEGECIVEVYRNGVILEQSAQI